MKTKLYQVVVWHNDSSCSMLLHRNRTAWTVKTAQKHRRECVAEHVAGNAKWKNVRAFTLVLL